MDSIHPGQLIGVRVRGIKHVGIVTGHDSNGQLMVISNSARVGSVAEETLSVFLGGRMPVPVEQLSTELPPWRILARARELIGKKHYDPFFWNCEHFVRYAYGLKQESPQLQNFVTVLGSVALFVGVVRLART